MIFKAQNVDFNRLHFDIIGSKNAVPRHMSFSQITG